MGLQFKVKKRAGSVYVTVRGRDGQPAGSLSSHAEENPCGSAWTVDFAKVTISGLGPLLYDLMIDLVHPQPLASDRAEVSPAARRVWDYYLDNRDDMEVIQLDDLRNTLTPVDDDNCEQSSAMIWAEDEMGDESEWPESPLSKAFKRPPSEGTPLLDKLQAMGMITFV
jgi:hypothetical protein